MGAEGGCGCSVSDETNMNELFERLYTQYADDVLRVAYFYLGDKQKAEDVCQDVFMRLLTRTPEIQEGHEKAWLLKVALNRCRDLWRAAWVKRVVLGSPFECIPAPDDMDSRIDDMMLREILNGFLGGLQEEKRNLFIRRYWYLDSIADIAERFALSESKVKTTLFRCRRQLREHLEKGGYKI